MKKPNKVIKFSDHARMTPAIPRGNESATVIILPTVKIERFGEPSTTDLPFLPPIKKIANTAKRARAKLQKQADTVEGALAWLASVAHAGADARAIACLLTTEPAAAVHELDFRDAIQWLIEFSAAWETERMANRRLRTIDEDHPA